MSIREGRQANNQFVDIEKWQAAVRELGVVRGRMGAACDAADSASCQAGTPIRTQSLREQINAVSSEIHRLGNQILLADSGELVGVEAAVWARRAGLKSAADRLGNRSSRVRNGSVTGHGSLPAHVRPEYSVQPTFLRKGLLDRVSRAGSPSYPVPTVPPHPVPTVPDPYVSQISTRTVSPAKQGPVKPDTSTPVLDSTQDPQSALAAVRRMLTDGGWGEDHVTHRELELIVEIFEGLNAAATTWVVRQLSSTELKLIADEMDSRGIANYNGLSARQKKVYIASLAVKLDGTEFTRIIEAFDDRDQFADVLAAMPGAIGAKSAFIEICKQRIGEGRKIGGETERWLRSLGAVLGSLEARPLGLFLRDHADTPALLAEIFRAAAGADLKISVSGSAAAFSSRSDISFQPEVLNRIALAAATLGPEFEAERLVAFQLVVRTLSAAFANSPLDNGTRELRDVVPSIYKLLGPNPVAFIDARKYELDVFRSWALIALKSGNSRMLVDLLSSIKQSTKKSDVFFMGYIVGLIQRAETEMADDKQAKLDLALGIIGAVVNGFSPAIVVSGTLGTIALGAVATEIQNGKSLWEVISRQVARRFNSDTFLNALFIDGRVMGWQ